MKDICMKWENFTAGRVASFKCKEGKTQSIFWDGRTPGLGLRVTAAGSKSYIFETSLKGKTIRITIGDISTYSIDAAQKIARAHRTLTDMGLDPRQVALDRQTEAQAIRSAKAAEAEARKQEARRRELKLSDVWPIYVDARKSKWSTGHLRNHVSLSAAGGEPKKRGQGKTVAGPMASLMPLALAELTGERVAEWLNAEAKARPTNAAQSYRLLRAFIRWTADSPAYRGLVPSEAYSSHRVREAVPKAQPADGDGLQREQLPSWFEAVRKIGNPVIAAYLQSLLLTGARREELATLRWSDVNFKWRSMTIKDKVEGTRTIPLTPYVANLMTNLPRHNDYVFCSPSSTSGHIEEPRIAHTRALAEAGLPHVSLQGLRRSFGTLCEWIEMPSGISAQIMGHKPSALAEKHYRRRPLDLLRKWHDQIEAWVLAQANVQFVPHAECIRPAAQT